MVQVTFDTNSDTLEELQESLKLLEQAIARRAGTSAHHAPAAPKRSKMDIAHPEPAEETAIDTPFFKITVKEEHETPAIPTLNQMIEDESLTEDELSKLFHEQVEREHPKDKLEKHKEEKVKEENQKEDAYIEIVEYADEKQ